MSNRSRITGGFVAMTTLVGAALPVFAGTVNQTTEAPMLAGANTFRTTALLTVGDSVVGSGGDYQFTGLPDGIGAMALDANTVRVLVNHEFGSSAGTPWTLANGTVVPGGARVSYLDIDRASRTVVEGGLAIQTIVDGDGNVIDGSSIGAFGAFNRFCSSSLAGAAEGLLDDVYFTGEETGGGRPFALDVATGTLYELADLGNGAWENIMIVPTVGTAMANKTILMLSDDSAGRPIYMYVGEKNAGSSDFLERNGLVGGQLHVFVADDGSNTNEELNGTGASVTGTWVPLFSNDPSANDVANMNALVAEAGAAGAFFFSRPEDTSYDKSNPSSGQVAFASTGRVTNLGDIDGDGSDDLIDDPWGTLYVVGVDVATLNDPTITGTLRVAFDGNDAANMDFGIRSPDNVDWAKDGYVYAQEDRSVGGFGQTSGREASIWRLDPATGAIMQVAQIDRSAVPSGTSDPVPNDIGNWESSGILEVGGLFGVTDGLLFLCDVQAHSITDGPIAMDDLVEGGQVLFLEVGPIERTGERPMMGGLFGYKTDALLTVGEQVAGDGAPHQFTGIPDGIGAVAWDADTVRLFVNHEFGGSAGTDWTLANGTVMPGGARISYLDVSTSSLEIELGGEAILSIVDWQGNAIDAGNQAAFGTFNRFCSGSAFGSKEGFADDIYFTGEENSGGRAFALDTATGTMYELGDFGNGAWENFTVLPTMGTPAAGKTAMILSDDSAGRPMYLYVGDQQPAGSFLERNGLVGGQLYVWASDTGENTNDEFAGAGSNLAGTWIPIFSNDPSANDVANMNALVAEAGAAGAFFFSRPEDVAYDAIGTTNGRFAMNSTGRVTNLGDIDGDGSDDLIDDPWGTIYVMTVDLASIGAGTITGSCTVLYDGNESQNQDYGVRSPDNMDWADDGKLYVQEDRSIGGFGLTSGHEASIWRIDPSNGGAVRVGEMDRGAVPLGQTDSNPTDIGNWESSGILDVSDLFGRDPGTLFVFDVQAHSLGGGIVAADDLVEGGQLLLMEYSGFTCAGDLDLDGAVDFDDLLTLLSAWGDCGGCAADLDDSGSVDFDDLLMLLSAWGPC